jgi:NADH-quinone oxidoreductase subunit J
MILQTIAFYIFAVALIFGGLMVISSRNPVHSVLFLIFAFFNAAALFILMGAELLALTLVIVYVGAVAVLFLFVVMMLDINFAELRQGFIKYLPVGALVGALFLGELVFVLGSWIIAGRAASLAAAPIPNPAQISNAAALGEVLYTQYVLYFQLAGIVLLVAMIGAIVLTLRQREGVRRQNIGRQVARTVAAGVELKKVKPGQGL